MIPFVVALVCVGAAPGMVFDVASEVDAIVGEFQAAQQDFYQKFDSAKTDADRQALYQSAPDPAPYVAKLKKIVEANAPQEATAKAASWALQYVREGWPVDHLADHFLETEHGERLAFMCTGLSSKHVLILDRLCEKGANRRIQGIATYNRGQQLLQMGDAAAELIEEGSSGNAYIGFAMNGMDDALRQRLKEEGAVEDLREEGLELLHECVDEYADVEMYKGSDYFIGRMAEGKIFQAERLQIGMVAPEIEGEDAEGVSFKLSDYRGKVVVLDFWGFW